MKFVILSNYILYVHDYLGEWGKALVTMLGIYSLKFQLECNSFDTMGVLLYSIFNIIPSNQQCIHYIGSGKGII